jgi:four helix bundle protein
MRVSSYKEWVGSVPEVIKADALWKLAAYRQALFLGDLAWHDITKINQNRYMWELCNQLYRSAGSISANIAEGYSRGSRKDRARFYEYALGSARESRDWYFKSRHLLEEEVFIHRRNLITEIIRLLLTMIPHQRQKTLSEPEPDYEF